MGVEICCWDCKEYAELDLTRQQPFSTYDVETSESVTVASYQYPILLSRFSSLFFVISVEESKGNERKY